MRPRPELRAFTPHILSGILYALGTCVMEKIPSAPPRTEDAENRGECLLFGTDPESGQSSILIEPS